MGMTLDELTRAIQQHIDLEMEEDVARGMAEHALGFFGFYNRIIDNALEPTDRNLFYMFQDYDLLTTESEETTLWDGREWRIHYWKFKPDLKERVESYMQRSKKTEDIDPYADVYSSGSTSIWTRESEKVVNPNAFTSDW
ncbi:MAG: DUF6015 family protein [Candidatus Poseidoniales archaeon]|jgi:hypothetical protein|nr:hypothetical protein [archaeon]MDA1168365.1 hypothetical protein [archaeon]